MHRTTKLALLLGLYLSAPALAVGGDIGYRGWGPRVGLASDPDQVIGGAHIDFGEFAKNVRFVPNAELGIGDDVFIVSVTAPEHYIWRDLPDTSTMPYVGGGVTGAFINPDDDNDDFDIDDGDDDFELGAKAIGGAEWQLKGGSHLFVELSVIAAGDVHDFEVVVGWLFGR